MRRAATLIDGLGGRVCTQPGLSALPFAEDALNSWAGKGELGQGREDAVLVVVDLW